MTVHVAVLGSGGPSAAALHTALIAIKAADAVDWQVLRAEDCGRRGENIDLVLTDSLQDIHSALERWPAAAVIALLPIVDDRHAAIAALDAGATVCVPGVDADLIAAYVHATARRHLRARPRRCSPYTSPGTGSGT